MTATAQVISAHATEIASYKEINSQELINYAEQHKGELVKIRIRVFNIVSDQELQGYFSGTYDDDAVVDMRVPFSGIYEDAVLTVYGRVQGNDCFQNAYDATICQPLIVDAFYEE